MSEKAMKMALKIFDWLEQRSIYQDAQIQEAHNELRKALIQHPKKQPVLYDYQSLGHAMLGEGKCFCATDNKVSLSNLRPGDKFILTRTGQVYSINLNGSYWNETEKRLARLHKNCQVQKLEICE